MSRAHQSIGAARDATDRPMSSRGDRGAAPSALATPIAGVARMRRRPKRAIGWTAFSVAALAAIGALAWVTASVLALEKREVLARAEAAHQQTVRLALWRMDSWMTPRLAAEAARPYFHYLAFYPPQRAYDQYLSAIAEGEVLTPSPLVGFRDDVIRLHLQVDARQRASSPQVPLGNHRDLAEGSGLLTTVQVTANTELLERAQLDIGGLPLASRIEEVVACQTAVFQDNIDPAIVGGAVVVGNPTAANAITALGDVSEESSWVATAKTELFVVEDAAASSGASDRKSDDPVAAIAAAAAKQARAGAAGVPTESAGKLTRDQQRDVTAEIQRSAPPSQSRAPTMAQSALSSMNRKVQSADNDYARRLATSNVAQTGQWLQFDGGFANGRVDIGPFVPLWVSHGEEGEGIPSLYYFRRVQTTDATMMQGFLVDWPMLCEALRGEVADLDPDARIVPVGVANEAQPPDAAGTRLASIPAQLVASPPAPPTTIGWSSLTPMRSILGVAWIALIAAVAAAGLSLNAVQSDAARRARFAGTVTHELRTPLTTFQLYTDLLADGMVAPERTGEYLATLRSESHRLGHLVENVLSYARIEQGRHVPTPTETTTAGLLARVEPALRRRVEEAGARLILVDATPDAARRWLLDVESVERILFNLVDNAAKYAVAGDAGEVEAAHRSGERPDAPAAAVEPPSPEIAVRAEIVADRLNLLVVDHGPGLPRDDSRRLFKPFERGDDDCTQGKRGIGLGLALSRELARALGGELAHEPTTGGGATFRVVL